MRKCICFGQNAVDQFAPEYNPDGNSGGGWSGLLAGPIPDARGLCQCASNMGYDSKAIFSGWNVGGPPAPGAPWVMTLDCTRAAWRQAHADLQAIAKPGDEFIVGQSGHGSQYMAAFYGNNESMCFADGTLTDVEFHKLMCGWPEGVKVVYVLDTCFSGGQDRDCQRFTPKVAPIWVGNRGIPTIEVKTGDIKAAVLQLCACRKDETAGDGPHNGVFTGSLLGVWQQAKSAGNLLTWRSWFDATAGVVATFAPQHPVLNILGAGASIVDDVLQM